MPLFILLFVAAVCAASTTTHAGVPPTKLYCLVPTKQTIAVLEENNTMWLDFAPVITVDELRSDSLRLDVYISGNEVENISANSNDVMELVSEFGSSLYDQTQWRVRSEDYVVQLSYAVKPFAEMSKNPSFSADDKHVALVFIQIWPPDYDTSLVESVDSAAVMTTEPYFEYDEFVKAIKYPEKARRNSIEDEIMVALLIDVRGRVADAALIKGTQPTLISEACRKAIQIPFTTATLEGEPVSVWVRLPIHFKLR